MDVVAAPRRLAADALRIFSGQTVWTAASVLAGVVIVRAVGPAGKGALAYATTVVTLATMALGGVTTAAMIAVAHRGVDRSAAERAALRFTGIAGTVIAVVLATIGVAVHSQRALVGSAAAVVPALLAGAVQIFLQYRGDVNRAVIVQQIAGTGVALTTALAVIAGGGVVGAFACWVVATSIAVVVGMRALRATSLRSVVAQGVIGATGTGITLLNVAGYLNLTIDVYVVAMLRPASELGIYALAVASGEMLWQCNRALLWPALRSIAHLGHAEAAALAGRIFRSSIALVGGVALVAYVAAPVAIRLVYGEAFAPAGDVLRLLLPGIVAMAGEAALGSWIMVGLGRTRELLAIQTASTVLCAAICVAGLPRYGIAAAAFATSITYCATLLAVAWLAVRKGFPSRYLIRA